MDGSRWPNAIICQQKNVCDKNGGVTPFESIPKSGSNISTNQQHIDPVDWEWSSGDAETDVGARALKHRW